MCLNIESFKVFMHHQSDIHKEGALSEGLKVSFEKKISYRKRYIEEGDKINAQKIRLLSRSES